jgi:glyoxylase-like metal-dependent hydrolase (beta-lactamase superfamily II)
VEVQELRAGLWRWTAPHPDWEPDEDWERDVGCVYYEAADAVVLIDPLVPAGEEERFWQALDRDVERAGRPVAVLVTIYWHARSAQAVADRYDGRIYAHEGAVELLAARDTRVTDPFHVHDPLPGGIVSVDTSRASETVFWLPEPRVLVPGDVILGADDGIRLCPASWLPKGYSLEELRRDLRPLLDRPVELVLVSHGRPVLEGAHEALAGALES